MIVPLFIFAILLGPASSAHVRSINVKNDKVMDVYTAIGIATIIETPEPIQSVIIGDQSGFKIEYLGNAVTIKPLRTGVRTNLYLVTQKQRYTLKLSTETQAKSDFIVYLKNANGLPKTHWHILNSQIKSGPSCLTIVRLGVSDGGFLLVEAKLSSTEKESVKISPDQFWITQSGNSKIVNGLFLSSLKLSVDAPIMIGVSIAKTDLEGRQPVVLEYRGKEKLKYTLPQGLVLK